MRRQGLYIILLFAIPLISCFGRPVERERADSKSIVESLATTLAAVECQTELDVQRIVSLAANSEMAVFFVHVDWAPMELRRTRFAEFALNYEQEHPESGVLFYYVDCTPVTDGYAPLVELNGWTDLQDGRSSLIHGGGEVVWMKNGRVVQVEGILNFESSSKLIRETEELFSRRWRSNPGATM